ncbi:hypothetical protein APHAL10511_003091 [Amanita phalloides]|nr:hypothetical protein APHAL10511_003091 [Amanita phalloides]
MQHFGKGALRVAKNYTKGYSDTQAKVRDATSNDPWGPSGTQMNELAQLTYNQTDFVEIMEMLDKRLNDKGKNWRHVFKSLTVLDYCLHQGSENVVIYFRDNLYIIKTLKEFQYMDEDGKDQGANVRQKAKDITSLLLDESRLREARRQRALMRDRMVRGGAEIGLDNGHEDENAPRQNGFSNPQASRRVNRDDDELQRAIEESKKSHAADELRVAEERDLQRAIQLSEEEENRRKEAVASSNATSLFDEQNEQNSPASSTGNTFPFTDPTPYAVGLQPQFTQVQPQFTAVQTQYTSFNPYLQQAEQEAAQAEYLRQQQLFLQQQQAQQQAQQQQDEWLRQQQLLQAQQEQLQQLQLQQQQQQLQQQHQQQQHQNLFLQAQQLSAQPTGFGSNNPFAPPQLTGTPSFSQPTQKQQPQFNLRGTYDTHSTSTLSSLSMPSTPASHPRQSPRPTVDVRTGRETTEHEQHLANLFANRDDGQDTFGNIGTLRYGHTDAGRTIVSHRTGASSLNPFAQKQQDSERPFFDI